MFRRLYMALLFVMLLICWPVAGQDGRDSVRIFFRQGRSYLDLSIGDNQASLERISDTLRVKQADPEYRVRKVAVVGGASPEGGVRLNEQLSRKRADVLFSSLAEYVHVPDSVMSFEYLGRDWGGLLSMIEADRLVPYRDEVMVLVRDIIAGGDDGVTVADGVNRLKALRGGEPYWYMYREMFPELRASRLVVCYDSPWDHGNVAEPAYASAVTAASYGTLLPAPVLSARYPQRRTPFYAALKTNMLYDALLIPNAGAELYLGGGWSMGAGWTHAWWKNDRKHNYWRIYGLDVDVRRWFGKAAVQKPLTGHHVGVYMQALTYDFETGGRGFIGGQPGGDIFDRSTWSAGVEYGYSMPVAERLNVDFNIGVGAHWGRQYEYTPEDNCYVWQSTSMKRWFGPTRAEVSLVWLIGRDNVNPGRGGRR